MMHCCESENGSTELNKLCTKLDVHRFSKRKFTFLTDYSKVLKPFFISREVGYSARGRQLLFWSVVANLRNSSQENKGHQA